MLEPLGVWARKATALQVGLFGWALSTFVACPPFFIWSWGAITVNSRAADYLRLCRNPLARDLVEPITAYRLTLPILAWILHLPPLAALVLPYLAHVGFLSVCFVALRRRMDPAAAALATVVVALSFALFWSNWKPGFTDTTTHLLAVSLMLTPAVRWTVAATFLGLLNDERMILALPFVLCWHYPPSFTAVWLRSAARWLTVTAAAVCAYTLVRHGLTVGWIGPGILRPRVYDNLGANLWAFRPHLGSWAAWGLNGFLSFRWAWGLIIAYLWYLIIRSQWTMAALFAGWLLCGLIASAFVADVARSVGFMAPAILVAAAGLEKEWLAKLPSRLLLIVIALILTPTFFTVDHFQIQWFRPLPLVLLRCFTGRDLAQLFHRV